MELPWQRMSTASPPSPPLLLMLLLTAALASLTAAGPCLDRLGRLHSEGTMFYDFPGTFRPCRIYQCVDGQKTVAEDRCEPKQTIQSATLLPKPSLQPAASARYLESRSSIAGKDAVWVESRARSSPRISSPSLPVSDNASSGSQTAWVESSAQSASHISSPSLPVSDGSSSGSKTASGSPSPSSSPSSGSNSTPAPSLPQPRVASPSSPSSSTSSSSSSSSSPSSSSSSSSSSSTSHSLPAVSDGSQGLQQDVAVSGRLSVSECTASNGRLYREGQTWIETTDQPCVHYVCRSSQKLVIYNATGDCKAISDGCEAKRDFGKCCPEPTNCVTPPQGCTSSSGRVYPEGQSWFESEDKPCYRYTCVAGRGRLVQNITCEGDNPLCRRRVQLAGQCCQQQTQCGCIEQSGSSLRERQDGELWLSPVDACVTLHCEEGRISELRRSPQSQPCPSPARADCEQVPPPPGVCACPTYRCTEPSSPLSCDSGGVVRAHGDTWQVSTCEAATCDNGLVRPVTITCPDLPPGCVPVRGADQCCPTCQDVPPHVPPPPASEAPTAAPRTEQPATTTEPTTTTEQRPDHSCEFEGSIYQNMQNWRDQCGTHVCINGEVKSRYVTCPIPTGLACAPIYQPGDCCARWSCKNAHFADICSNVRLPSTESEFCHRPNEEEEGLCTNSTRLVLGSCCPVYECLSNCLYKDDPTRHRHGSTWEADCHIHTCFNGTVNSTRKGCPEPGDLRCRLTNPGECCPIHDCECDYEGTRRENGDHWTSSCKNHWCNRGEVQDTPVPCPGPPRPDCTPLPMGDDQCCPEFECSCEAVTCPPAPSRPGCSTSGISADGCCTLYTCPGDCVDEENRDHMDGSVWRVGCAQHKCSGGNITRADMPCPPPPSDNCTKVFLTDTCCPIYDCPAPACSPGESSFDGCNLCECSPPGVLFCTNKTCAENSCIVGDHANKTTLSHNETLIKPANPCFEYTCRYGAVMNRVIQCAPKPGPKCVEAPPKAGKCCPDWSCPVASCPLGAASVPRSWEDDCNICTCTESGVVCTDFDCHRKCEKDGKTYNTPDVMPGSGDCAESVCVDGVAISVYEPCLNPPPNVTCTPSEEYKSEDCCPNWVCSDLPGIPSPCEVGQMYQGDQECLYCECVPSQTDGTPEMICTKRDCVRAGCDGGEQYREHGSVWAAAEPCRQVACVSGRTTLMEVKCPDVKHPHGSNCVPVPDSGRCCPLYYCGEKCTYEGSKKLGCNSCICRDGVELCTTNQCDDADSEQTDTPVSS